MTRKDFIARLMIAQINSFEVKPNEELVLEVFHQCEDIVDTLDEFELFDEDE